MNEEDMCRTYVLPKLKSAGWEDEHISEQMVLTPGCIVAYLDCVKVQEELDALLPGILDKAFKREL